MAGCLDWCDGGHSPVAKRGTMSRTSELLGMAAAAVRWGLPWLGALAVSAGTTFAVMLALADLSSSGHSSTPIVVQAAPQELATPESVSEALADTTCVVRLGGGNPTHGDRPELTAPDAWCGQ